MRKFLLFAGILSFSITAVHAKEFIIDSAHSSANFKIRHLISKVSGSFNDFSGSFSFDEKSPKAFQGEFTVKTASINTNNAKRDEHLRGDDFFGAEKNPLMTFKSKEMTPAGKNKYKMLGDLTMRGVTKPVTFNVEYTGSGKDPWGTEKAGFSASTTINRKDWGMVWNKTLDSGSVMLSDEVELDIQVEANAQAVADAKK
jgi:polyisoprenoid-binding protein YceI